MGVTLREATDADADILWAWANDPDVRAQSFDTHHIGLMEHAHWFEEHQAEVLMAEVDGELVGTVRTCRDEVSITIAPAHRGKEIAPEILHWFAAFATYPLLARIKPDNERSLRAFSKAGFVVDHIVMRHE